MRLTWRDGLATVFVGVGVSAYALWEGGVTIFGFSSASSVGLLILGLGLAASLIAVVYGVGAGLLQARKSYLAIASLGGLTALVAGVGVLLTGNEGWLAVLVAATAVLWLMSTIRHAMTPGARAGKGEAANHKHLRMAA